MDGAQGGAQIAVEWVKLITCLIAVPISLGAIVVIACSIAHCGLNWEWSLLAPQSERLSLSNGLQQFGTRLREGWYVVLKALAPFLLFAFYGFTGSAEAVLLGSLAALAVDQVFYAVMGQIIWVGSLVLVLIAGFDLWRTRRAFRIKLSMSHDEMKREWREHEGDPMVKAMQRSMAESLLMRDVEKRVRNSRFVVVARSARPIHGGQ